MSAARTRGSACAACGGGTARGERRTAPTANELFAFLMYVVRYVCIHVGETLDRTKQKKITTSWQPRLVDRDSTALQLAM